MDYFEFHKAKQIFFKKLCEFLESLPRHRRREILINTQILQTQPN